jgi:hypothetical protein
VQNHGVGFVKRQMEEEEARGWRGGGEKWVCAEHVEDEALVELIAANPSSTSCSYCDRVEAEPFAAELDLVIERIGTSVPYEWGNADDEGVGWEGGYLGQTYDSYDLVTEALDFPLNHGGLIADVAAALPEQAWAQRDFYRLRPDERLRFGWEEFGEIVKHRRRYFFSDHRPDDLDGDPDYIAPGAMLAAIGEAVKDADLVLDLLTGTPVLRVRAHQGGDRPDTANQLGAPPVELVFGSSRMSAAGTPMFYGALDEPTASIEARETNPGAEAFTLACFELRRPARVVDLSVRPEVPSLFDPERRHLRPPHIFLRYFATAIAEPFVRDERVHIEYVPTQVVTEWLRTRFDPGPGRPIEGVLYQSARSSGGINAALFIDNDGACDPDDEDAGALLVLRGSELLS